MLARVLAAGSTLLAALALPLTPAHARMIDTIPEQLYQPRDRLSQTAAAKVFQSHGIGWRSNGHCTDRNTLGCTSFEGLRWGSVSGLLGFQRDSACPLTISGGTERGHATATYSHWNGYKLDVMPTDCVTRFIEHTYKYVGLRGDGAEMYKAPTGYIYADEHATHWDIVFTTAWWRQMGH